MRLNKLSETDIEQLLDMLLKPDVLKSFLGTIKDTRAEANKAIEELNQRDAETEAKAAELANLDKSFDGARAEIAAAKEDLKKREDAMAAREASVAKGEADNKGLLAQARQLQNDLAVREKDLSTVVAKAQAEADAKVKSVQEQQAAAETLMAEAQKLSKEANDLRESLRQREADLLSKLTGR